MNRERSRRELTGRISSGTSRQPTPDGEDRYRPLREGAHARARRDPAGGPRAGRDPVLPTAGGRGGTRGQDGGRRAGDARGEQLPRADPRPAGEAGGGGGPWAGRDGGEPGAGPERADPPAR